MKGSIYTTKDFPVKIDYYYIVNLNDLFKPVVLPVYFANKVAAKRAIKTNVKNLQSRKKYHIMPGNKLRNMDMNYRLAEGVMRFFSKYDYEPGMTKKQKKLMRDNRRRRLRRMNLYAKPKIKKHIKDPIKQTKQVINTQWTTTAPTSTARGFTIERKGPNWIYLVLKKRLTKKAGKLFKIYVIRINLKKGAAFNRKWIYTHRNDVLEPLLLNEIPPLLKGKKYEAELIEILKKEFWPKVNHRGAKGIFQGLV